MMEEADAGKDHGHVVFIRCLNDRIIAIGATGFQYIFHAAGRCAVHAVTEWEEGIRSESDRVKFGKPLLLFVRSQLAGSLREDFSPISLFIERDIIAQKLINGIIAVGATDASLEGQIQNRGMLAQPPQ